MEDRSPLSPLRVLVVEDSADVGESTVMLLRMWGCDARVAADGPAALEAAADYHPDVILLDIGLPGMDGFEVAKRLRGLTAAPAAPLVVSLSGYAAEEDRRRALESGCDLAWAKPADPQELRRLVASHEPREMRQVLAGYRAAPTCN